MIYWLGISRDMRLVLADTTVIQITMVLLGRISDRGLPSDNPYTLNQSVSGKRLVSWDAQDANVLIAHILLQKSAVSLRSGWHFAIPLFLVRI
jgi:hypothetical protein